MKIITDQDCPPGRFLGELQRATRKHAETVEQLHKTPSEVARMLELPTVALDGVSIGELAHAIRFSGLWLRDAAGGWIVYRAESPRVAPQEVRDAPGGRRSHWTPPMEMNNADDICGFCGLPGGDKIPHPVRWPGEESAGTKYVHAMCEDSECARAHSALTDRERQAFLKTIK